ncbi:MAG TPA: hypothetical protein VFY40_12045 [Blastocatellia bacterium]|nr:hypothetical protein [Blastocatellia bacterium]
MSEKDVFTQRKIGLEEEYFRKKEQELLEQIRRHTALQAEREELAEATGIADEEILATLREMGYTRETVGLLHLVPLVQVAWASGSVTPRERELVLRLSEWRGVRNDSPAWEQLNNWLDERPSDDFFLKTLRIIRILLDFQTAKERVTSRTDLISFCIRIANASGGFMGVGSKISEGEQAALDQIVEELNGRNPKAVRQMVEES